MGKAYSSFKEKREGAWIRQEIHELPVVVYTKLDCAHCKMAKELLDRERISYKEHELKKIEQENPREYKKYIKGLDRITGQTTVPQIFICGGFIGGFKELRNLYLDGQLGEEVSRCDNNY